MEFVISSEVEKSRRRTSDRMRSLDCARDDRYTSRTAPCRPAQR